jgi:solute:Na+ symporter, SSS family
MKLMEADPGDLLYITDARRWMGGLKSVHSVFGEPHNEDGVVYITNEHLEAAKFVKGRKLRAEKEM